jgi:hypothetical protein
MDRVAVEEFVAASMIEKNREQASDFCTTALGKRQPPKP